MNKFLNYLIENRVQTQKIGVIYILMLVLLAIFNPNQNDFIMYESQKFNKNMEIAGCERYKYGGGVMYDANSGLYKEKCKEIVGEYRQNPTQLISYITANTKRNNWIVFSIYETEYREFYNEIDKLVKSDPKYVPYHKLPGTYSLVENSEDFISANEAIGIGGNFFEWR